MSLKKWNYFPFLVIAPDNPCFNQNVDILFYFSTHKNSAVYLSDARVTFCLFLFFLFFFLFLFFLFFCFLQGTGIDQPNYRRTISALRKHIQINLCSQKVARSIEKQIENSGLKAANFRKKKNK